MEIGWLPGIYMRLMDGWMHSHSLLRRAHALITNPQIEVSKFVPENSI